MADSSWQERYDRSVREVEEAAKRADAERSTAEKIIERSTPTGTGLDLIIFPFVTLAHGIAALLRRRKHSRRP